MEKHRSTEDESRTDFLEKAEYRFHKGDGDVVFQHSRMNRSLKSDVVFGSRGWR